MDGGSGNGSGVGSVAGNVTGVMTQVFESMKEITGIDLQEIVKAQSYDAKVNRNINISTTPEVSEAIKDVVDKTVE
jgi:flotillin